MAPLDKDPGREPEIATGTLAEIYAQQGLFERALEIYRRIRDRRPGDAEIARRIAALEEAVARRESEAGESREGETAAAAPAPAPVAPPEPESGAAPEPADRAGPGTRPEPAPDPADPDPSAAPPLERDDAFRDWLDRR